MSMGTSSSKDYCAYPDSTFYYAAPSAIHLYANPRKAGVAIAHPGVDFTRRSPFRYPPNEITNIFYLIEFAY
jgi:hypothetical protein